MARVIKAVKYHNCHQEIKASIDPHQPTKDTLWYGTIIECSCGKKFILTESQKDGAYWAPYTPPAEPPAEPPKAPPPRRQPDDYMRGGYSIGDRYMDH